MNSRRKRKAKEASTHVHPTVDDQKILIEASIRCQRGESIEDVLEKIPEPLKSAIEDSLRSQIPWPEIVEKLCMHFKIGAAAVGDQAVFTMMAYRDSTEREIVSVLMIPPERVLEFAEIVGTAAKAFFTKAETH